MPLVRAWRHGDMHRAISKHMKIKVAKWLDGEQTHHPKQKKERRFSHTVDADCSSG